MWPHPALAILHVTAGHSDTCGGIWRRMSTSIACLYVRTTPYVDISERFWCLSQHNGRQLFQSKYLQRPLTGTL